MVENFCVSLFFPNCPVDQKRVVHACALSNNKSLCVSAAAPVNTLDALRLSPLAASIVLRTPGSRFAPVPPQRENTFDALRLVPLAASTMLRTPIGRDARVGRHARFAQGHRAIVRSPCSFIVNCGVAFQMKFIPVVLWLWSMLGFLDETCHVCVSNIFLKFMLRNDGMTATPQSEVGKRA